jgi:hypothetical protein
MTIWSINQVHGIRVSRLELYEWINGHQDHEWYRIINKQFEDYGESFIDFIQYVKSLKTTDAFYQDIYPDRIMYPGTYDDIYQDIRFDQFTKLPCYDTHPFNKEMNEKMNEEFKIELYGLTHDTDSSDFIFGIVVCRTEILVPLKETVDPESNRNQTVTLSDGMAVYNYNIDVLRNHIFVKDMGRELSMYMVQGDCVCCS